MHSFETFSFFLSSFLRQIAFAAASLPPRRIRYTERQRALPLRAFVAQSAKFSPSLPPSQNLRSPLLPRRRPTEKMKPGGEPGKGSPFFPPGRGEASPSGVKREQFPSVTQRSELGALSPNHRNLRRRLPPEIDEPRGGFSLSLLRRRGGSIIGQILSA